MKQIDKVLFIVENLENNGPVYNCLSLAREYKRKGIDSLTLSLSAGGRESSFLSAGLHYMVSRKIGCFLRAGTDRKKIREYKPAIIHALDYNVFRTAKKLSKLTGAPFVYTQNRCIEKNISTRIKNHEIIAVSDAVQMSLIKNGKINRSQIEVIHNGIDLNRYVIPSQRADGSQLINDTSAEKTQVVGSLGTLLPEKGQRLLLKAAETVLKKHKNIEFIIIGQGPDLNPLRKLAVEMNISNRITFTSGLNFVTNICGNDGVKSKQEAVFLRDFDIFVEPSINEGLGLSAMQAMAWGRPVVAFGAGGLYSLIDDGINGYLVPKENDKAMAESISKLLSDSAMADQMGLQGREKIEQNFNIRSIADKHLSYYKNIISKYSV